MGTTWERDCHELSLGWSHPYPSALICFGYHTELTALQTFGNFLTELFSTQIYTVLHNMYLWNCPGASRLAFEVHLRLWKPAHCLGQLEPTWYTAIQRPTLLGSKERNVRTLSFDMFWCHKWLRWASRTEPVLLGLTQASPNISHLLDSIYIYLHSIPEHRIFLVSLPVLSPKLWAAASRLRGRQKTGAPDRRPKPAETTPIFGIELFSAKGN